MRVMILSDWRDAMEQHGAELLKIFLPVVAEIVRKSGDEALEGVHFSGGEMALRNAGRFARDPNRGHIFSSGPELDEHGLRIESRLDGAECESFGAKS